jgi:hypothetical protein
MIWINPRTGNHDAGRFLTFLHRAAKCANRLARQPEFVSIHSKTIDFVCFRAWQNPPGLPYGNVALQ